MFVICGHNIPLGIYRTMGEAVAALRATPHLNPISTNSGANTAHYAEYFGYDELGKCLVYTITEVRPTGPKRLF